MFLKCVDCGHIFEDGEQTVTREYHSEIPGGFYEEFSSCPICGGDYEKTHACQMCGGEFLDDELRWGFCEDCLKESATPENFLEFSEWAHSGHDYSELSDLDRFMLSCIYCVSENDIKGGSKKFHSLMEARFQWEAYANALGVEHGEKDRLTPLIWAYLKRSPDLLINDFAEWLHDKEVKK